MKYAILLIIFFLIARVIVAFREAEQFDDPIADRSVLWHLLKIPHELSLVICGATTLAMVWMCGFLVTALSWAAALVLGYFVFEYFLTFFRRKE